MCVVVICKLLDFCHKNALDAVTYVVKGTVELAVAADRYMLYQYGLKLDPQPQVVWACGLLITKLLPITDSS